MFKIYSHPPFGVVVCKRKRWNRPVMCSTWVNVPFKMRGVSLSYMTLPVVQISGEKHSCSRHPSHLWDDIISHVLFTKTYKDQLSLASYLVSMRWQREGNWGQFTKGYTGGHFFQVANSFREKKGDFKHLEFKVKTSYAFDPNRYCFHAELCDFNSIDVNLPST